MEEDVGRSKISGGGGVGRDELEEGKMEWSRVD